MYQKRKKNLDLDIGIAFSFNLEIKNICKYFYRDFFLNKMSL